MTLDIKSFIIWEIIMQNSSLWATYNNNKDELKCNACPKPLHCSNVKTAYHGEKPIQNLILQFNTWGE